MMNKSTGATVNLVREMRNGEKNCGYGLKSGNVKAGKWKRKPRFFGMLDVTFYIIQKKNGIDVCLDSLRLVKCPENVSKIDVVYDPKQSKVYGSTIARPANIQIILPSTTLIVNENILYDIIDILEADHDISLLGVRGTADMPLSGRWQDAEHIYGGVYEMQPNGKIREHEYREAKSKYELVQRIDDTMLVLAGLPAWTNCDENEFLGAKLSDFANNLGYKVATATSEHPWCMMLDEEHIVDNGLVLPEYVNYLQNERFSLGEAKRFFTYGRHSNIGENSYFSHPSRIYIGDHVQIGSGAYFTLEAEDAVVSVGNYVAMGDMVTIRSRLAVEIGHHVRLRNNVVVDDTTENGRFADIKIGSYAILEDDVTVLGGVTLGSACTVMAGSVVRDSLPAYCVAAGCPARIISLYDSRDNSWKNEPDDKCVEDILRGRSESPLLSIGVPTYNRSLYLRKALKFICDAVDKDDLVEIYVSDNCSEDCTQDLVEEFEGICPNLRYCRQEKNVGATNNFLSIWEKVQGKYVWLLGDDDYISQNIVHDLVTLIMNRAGFSICAVRMMKEGICFLQAGRGMDSYVLDFNYNMTAITLLVLNREAYLRLEDKTRFIHTDLNQVYIQMELLRHNPDYMILYDYMAGFGMGDANRKYVPYESRGLLFEIFVRQFFDILLFYVENGDLMRSTYADFLKLYFDGWMHTYIELMKQSSFVYKFDENAMAILKKYYGAEPYYNEVKRYVEEAIVNEKKD